MTPGLNIGGDGSDFDVRRVVSALVERCDALAADKELLRAEITELKTENEALKEEIRHLKRLPPRPKFKAKPSGMEKAKLEVTREVRLKVKAPAGSRFKGYQDVLVQDLQLNVEVVRYRREIWQTATGERIAADLPCGIMGGDLPPLDPSI